MIFSKNRFPLFGIMLQIKTQIAARAETRSRSVRLVFGSCFLPGGLRAARLRL
jgi:hypothetical protein